MAMLLKNNYFMVTIHRFSISIWLYCPLWWRSKKEKGTKGLDQLKEAFEYENTRSNFKSNVAINWEK